MEHLALGLGDWSFNTLLMCFAGGILGASLGGLYAFVICALAVLLGCMSVLGGGPEFFLLNVGLGPIFGPHVGGFASGCAAVSYAVGVKKNLESASGKDIISPLIDTSWDVLLVGGVFAVFGHAVLNLLVKIPWVSDFDCIALTVVISAMLARLLFHQGEMPWGTKESIKEHGYLKWPCQWIPWMNVPSRQIVFGFGAGIFAGSLAWWAKGVTDPLIAAKTISGLAGFLTCIILSWSIASFSLIALQLGNDAIQKVPVWHCQSILAALAYMHFDSILIAGFVGIGAIFLQDLMGRMFWNHGSNHVDPPACAIATGTFILNNINRLT